MDNCQACERKFEEILDYPLITIKKVERGKTSALAKLANLVAVDEKVRYHDPHPNFRETNLDEVSEPFRRYVIIEKVAPEGLQKLFAGKPKEFVGPVEFEGWQYVSEKMEVRAESGPEVIPQLASRVDSKFLPPAIGTSMIYTRFKQARPYVEAQIGVLEDLVGREVSRAELAGVLNMLCCRQPELYLRHSPGREFSGLYSIIVADTREYDRINPNTANIDLCESLGGTHGEYKTVATLAVIDYEGRPLTVEEQIQRGKNG